MEFYRHEEKIQVDVYEDDTLEMAYYKISVAVNCPINDLYLFSSRYYDTYTKEQQYNRLYDPEYNGVPAFKLQNFHEDVNRSMPEVHEDRVYQEDDLVDLHKVWIAFPIGPRIQSAADPSRVVELDQFPIPESDHSTFQQLMLDFMPFQKVHVCCKSDYKGFDAYFTHVPLVAEAMKRQNDTLVKLYDLAPKYEPLLNGITRVLCRIDPIRPMAIPLDTLFNYLHVSDEIPMIQYHNGNDANIMYKLLSHEVDLKGDKIPVMDRKTVSKYYKSYPKSVTMFTNKKEVELKYGFMGDGSILMEIKCDESTVEEIDIEFRKNDGIVQRVHEFMYQGGFTYPSFRGIRAATILSMDTSSVFQCSNKRDCANPFFVGSGENTRYRRVSKFDENALIDELCIEYFDQDKTDKIAPLIAQIRGISDAAARTIATERIREFEVLREQNPTRRFARKERVGFVSSVTHKNDKIRMEITGITSFYYMDSIQRNTRAYVAFQSTPAIQCQEHAPQALRAIQVRYVDDSESDESETEAFEFNDTDSDMEGGAFEFDTDDMEGGGKDLDLIIRNESFLITRVKQMFKPSADYAKKCPLERRPVVLKPEEINAAALEPFKANTHTHEGNTFVCTKYWDMQRKIPLKEVGNLKEIKERNVDHEVVFDRDGTVLDIQPDGDYPYPGIMRHDDRDAPCCYGRPRVKGPDKKIAESKQYIVKNSHSLNNPGQGGWLPLSLRYFFGLNENDTHLLRYGIPKPHSFIQCIEAVFKKSFESSNTLFDQMIDTWVKPGWNTYNNGNLKRQFKTIQEFREHLPEMDYTYLWEIVCDLFRVNLVIFRDPRNGNDLEVICPSNQYSTREFDPSKKSLLILEHTLEKGYAFELLVGRDVKKNAQVMLHDSTNKHLHEGFKALAQIFWKCKTTSASYTPNLMASVMHAKLNRPRQVVRQDKCIGFVVEGFFVPCYPSAVLPVPFDIEIPVKEYRATVAKLQTLAKVIPCMPRFKVVDHEIITGIILETSAFVPCIPLANYDTGLKRYSSVVQYEYEPLPREPEADRLQKTHRIKAEKCLYAATRRQLKEVLGKDSIKRGEINQLIKHKSVTEKDVRTVLSPHVKMVDKMDESFIQTQVKCGGCCFAADQLILPTKNLVTGEPNHYFARLAEELNYYTRFSAFIMSPQLSIQEVPFAVNDNELLLTTSTLKHYYGALMEAKRLPEYYTTFDNANPKHKPSRIRILKVQKLDMIGIPSS